MDKFLELFGIDLGTFAAAVTFLVIAVNWLKDYFPKITKQVTVGVVGALSLATAFALGDTAQQIIILTIALTIASTGGWSTAERLTGNAKT